MQKINLLHTLDGTGLECLTFPRSTKEHNGVVLPESVFPKPGEIFRIVKRDIVIGRS